MRATRRINHGRRFRRASPDWKFKLQHTQLIQVDVGCSHPLTAHISKTLPTVTARGVGGGRQEMGRIHLGEDPPR
eukprot:scaffold321789_cov30-Tisochrysis_lutea.AAC.4